MGGWTAEVVDEEILQALLGSDDEGAEVYEGVMEGFDDSDEGEEEFEEEMGAGASSSAPFPGRSHHHHRMEMGEDEQDEFSALDALIQRGGGIVKNKEQCSMYKLRSIPSLSCSASLTAFGLVPIAAFFSFGREGYAIPSTRILLFLPFSVCCTIRVGVRKHADQFALYRMRMEREWCTWTMRAFEWCEERRVACGMTVRTG